MKKTLLVLVALLLTAAVFCAQADEMMITAGTPTASTSEDFITSFISTADQAGYSFEWNGESSNEGGFDIFYLHSSDGKFTVKVYTVGGMVCIVTGEGVAIITGDDSSSASKLGEWLAVSIYATMPCLYEAEGKEYGETDFRLCEAEVRSMITSLQIKSINTGKLANGITVIGSFLDYPGGMEMKQVGSQIASTMTVGFAVTTKDGQITVKEE